MRRLLASAMILVLAGCDRLPRIPTGPTPHPAAAEAGAVYAVLLDSMQRRRAGGPPGMHRYVQVETVQEPRHVSVDDLLRSMPDVTPELLEAFFARNRQSDDLRALVRRGGIEWMRRDSLPQLSRNAAGVYVHPAEQYTITSISRVGFSVDGRLALAYTRYWCGLRCGEGNWALLARQPGGRWELRQTLRTFVS